MLAELHIEDLGVIDRLDLLLGAGLVAVTGETGAGKTMLIEAINLLVGGRAEFFVGLSAAIDRPLLGHGSWPTDTGEAVERAASRFGIEINNAADRRDPHVETLIPTHSAVVGAWVEHGIMGGIFWLSMLGLLLRNTPRAVRLLPESTGLVVFNAPAAVWAIFFSPIPARAASILTASP